MTWPVLWPLWRPAKDRYLEDFEIDLFFFTASRLIRPPCNDANDANDANDMHRIWLECDLMTWWLEHDASDTADTGHEASRSAELKLSGSKRWTSSVYNCVIPNHTPISAEWRHRNARTPVAALGSATLRRYVIRSTEPRASAMRSRQRHSWRQSPSVPHGTHCKRINQNLLRIRSNKIQQDRTRSNKMSM